MTNTAEAVKEEEAKMLARSVAEDQLCEEAPRVFTWLLSSISILLVIITAPLSLLFVLKVVQENIFFFYKYGDATKDCGSKFYKNLQSNCLQGKRLFFFL